MATTDYDFILTRNDIIHAAMRKVGALYPGDSPRAEELSAAVDALHTMVDDWQNKHVFLWSLSPQTITLVASTDNYSLQTDPHVFSIEKAYFRDSNSNDTEIEIVSYREYQDIVDKDASGEPTVMAIHNTVAPTAYVWPVPEAAGTIYYLGLTRLKDFDSSTTIADFTHRWQKALIYGLAADLAPEYGVKITEQREFRGMANSYLTTAMGGDRDRPTSVVVEGAY